MNDQTLAQAAYHEPMFKAVLQPDAFHHAVVGFTGDCSVHGMIGLDQLGHFGPQGAALVAEVISDRHSSVRLVCELGSGVGGVLRFLADDLPDTLVVGVELVPEHCQVSGRLDRLLGVRSAAVLNASATLVPLRAGSVDAVAITGSLAHFANPGRVFAEAARVLGIGGMLVATEEVSLCNGEALSDEFVALHPPEVFFCSTWTQRVRQLKSAGFSTVERRQLGPWAVDLLLQRIEALELFGGTAVGIFGQRSVDSIKRTLAVTVEEYRSGRLVPALVLATV